MAMRVGLREVLNNLPGLLAASAAFRLEELPDDEIDVLVVVLPAAFDRPPEGVAVLYLADNSADLNEVLDPPNQNWGVLPVNASENELQAAIQALAEGLWVGSPVLVGQYLKRQPVRATDEPDSTIPALTEREIEVLQLTAQGLANKQIALRLGISEHTIKFHLSSLYSKLGVSSRMEAVRAGARRGLVIL